MLQLRKRLREKKDRELRVFKGFRVEGTRLGVQGLWGFRV